MVSFPGKLFLQGGKENSGSGERSSDSGRKNSGGGERFPGTGHGEPGGGERFSGTGKEDSGSGEMFPGTGNEIKTSKFSLIHIKTNLLWQQQQLTAFFLTSSATL